MDESLAPLVLVADDEPAVRAAVADALEAHAYRVVTAEDGPAALRAVSAHGPDLVLLDVLMPGIDGLGVCRALRAAGNRVPILVLTARAAADDRVGGLDAGADDYVVKPYHLGELLARVRALLRRGGPEPDGAPPRVADLVLDPVSRQGRRGERTIQFTGTEFALLELLLRNRGQVLTREVITERVWGYDFGPASNPVEVYIRYLRRKLEAEGEPRLVHTVRGVGYQLREP
ncbi:response regulator transcription factor [Amycolatopsis sp. PS_44_ISF1]|uniref:response regulator transcription factor n=1 Tax=Amycolatopsis sp. PS_44_ISF1 TaxID=2974917 RepID=UPI0028DF26D8|nr:response regulator transcription factor [Amycolatopsis sp. PS_44_ISF1]MDT8913235.1 response regulator transcription factor [Amycolatopsis sp. PS_44_ISF1]